MYPANEAQPIKNIKNWNSGVEPDGHSDWAQEILCGDGRNFQMDNHHCNTNQAIWQSGRIEA